jgi:hypothetical protein
MDKQKLEWHFRRMRPSEQNRDPTEGEHFRGDEPVASIVRETIQNSLDAKADKERPVRVVFHIVGKEAALDPDISSCWLQGLRPHLEAREKAEGYLLDEPMTFIAIEDFGTRGLEGDPMAAGSDELHGEGPHDFYYFFRNVGITGKHAGEKGSWGLGKSVLPEISKIGCFLGWTRRCENPQNLLMGQSVSKIHHVASPTSDNRVKHDATGFFGLDAVRLDDHDFIVPVTEQACIKKFKNHFSLLRNVSENGASNAGLSLVIPFPRDELIEKDVETQFIINIVEHYAYPILRGKLIVDIRRQNKARRLDPDNLLKVVSQLKRHRNQDLHRFVQLVTKVVEPGLPTVKLSYPALPSKQKNNWDELKASEAEMEKQRRTYLSGLPIGFQIPVSIRPRSKKPVLTFAIIYFQRWEGSDCEHLTFIREGLSIPSVRSQLARDNIVMVIIEDPPLANLLRDAENPAHTNWLPKARRLLANYVGGQAVINFLKKAPSILQRKLMDTCQENDVDILNDYFPLSGPGPTNRKKSTGDGAGDSTGADGPDSLPPKQKPFHLKLYKDGFKLARNQKQSLKTRFLTLNVAFDCASGNPFQAWEPFDFDFKEDIIQFEIRGGRILGYQQNQLEIEILKDRFQFTATGFARGGSAVRDLVVRESYS